MSNNPLIQQAAERIKRAKKLVILTGAGVSKESGVPTFRDAQEGLWAKYNPEELATPFAFKKNPKLVWDWYEFRRGLVKQAQPNPGHYALAELQKRNPSTRVITQNVDDLHEQAGSKDVIHLHGNIAESRCSANCLGQPTLIDVAALSYDPEVGPPKCPHCGAYLRPNVVWFHEMLPQMEIADAYNACEEADLMIIIGTSGMVTPASNLPEIAKHEGAFIIEINPVDSMITPIANMKLDGPSGEILPQIIAAMYQ